MTNPQPGWYPDPADATRIRYWDGTAWTARVADSDAERAGDEHEAGVVVAARARQASEPSVDTGSLPAPMGAGSKRGKRRKRGAAVPAVRASESATVDRASESTSAERAVDSASAERAVDSASADRALDSMPADRALDSASADHVSEPESADRALDSASTDHASEPESADRALDSASADHAGAAPETRADATSAAAGAVPTATHVEAPARAPEADDQSAYETEAISAAAAESDGVSLSAESVEGSEANEARAEQHSALSQDSAQSPRSSDAHDAAEPQDAPASQTDAESQDAADQQAAGEPAPAGTSGSPSARRPRTRREARRQLAAESSVAHVHTNSIVVPKATDPERTSTAGRKADVSADADIDTDIDTDGAAASETPLDADEPAAAKRGKRRARTRRSALPWAIAAASAVIAIGAVAALMLLRPADPAAAKLSTEDVNAALLTDVDLRNLFEDPELSRVSGHEYSVDTDLAGQLAWAPDAPVECRLLAARLPVDIRDTEAKNAIRDYAVTQGADTPTQYWHADLRAFPSTSAAEKHMSQVSEHISKCGDTIEYSANISYAIETFASSALPDGAVAWLKRSTRKSSTTQIVEIQVRNVVARVTTVNLSDDERDALISALDAKLRR